MYVRDMLVSQCLHNIQTCPGAMIHLMLEDGNSYGMLFYGMSPNKF